MAAPDPEGMSLLGKIVSAAVGIVVPVWGARTWVENRFNKKLNKDDFKEFISRFEDRFDKHCENDREVQAKLFDKVDEVKNILIERG